MMVVSVKSLIRRSRQLFESRWTWFFSPLFLIFFLFFFLSEGGFKKRCLTCPKDLSPPENFMYGSAHCIHSNVHCTLPVEQVYTVCTLPTAYGSIVWKITHCIYTAHCMCITHCMYTAHCMDFTHCMCISITHSITLLTVCVLHTACTLLTACASHFCMCISIIRTACTLLTACVLVLHTYCMYTAHCMCITHCRYTG